MIQLTRTNSSNNDFIQLVKLLDAELAIRDGDDHEFYNQFNNIDTLKYVIIAYEDEKPLGCGAIKEYTILTTEVKRMYVIPKNRGKGIASRILLELELWATELNYEKCILETGKKQHEAIELYKKRNYRLIPNYAQYADIENSLCFEKKLNPNP
jgi:GNAT superfamily N-acetyltransferase